MPGFYDNVLPLSDAERELIARLPFDEKAWLADAGNSGAAAGEAGYGTLERVWTRPTAEVNGMWGGHTGPGGKTIVPAAAHAKLSFRLVANQEPGRRHRRAAAVRARPHAAGHRGHGDLGRARRPAVLLADGLAGRAGGPARRWSGHSAREILFTREGGSGPEADLADILAAPLVFVAVGLDADRIHAPNERVDMALLLKGAEASAYLWDELAAAAGELTAGR